ncbi:hypothetical protein BHM03_00001258 [Ensete ventricosum]|uniref:Zinc transporter n=1 Tax=Ensete ventricosum TaxID=4639 RepID=A0A445M925_ENSVE|nr:hypothetical protein BHM03_00001258 [Ensete ventricosum]
MEDEEVAPEMDDHATNEMEMEMAKAVGGADDDREGADVEDFDVGQEARSELEPESVRVPGEYQPEGLGGINGDAEGEAMGNDKARCWPWQTLRGERSGASAVDERLTGMTIGVCIPILGKWWPALHPENDAFFVIKSFAAGVILATGFVHILPDAFDGLTSSCLGRSPWQKFPFAGFGAMIAAIATLMLDTVATGYFNRSHSARARMAAVIDETKADMEAPHGMHGHNNVHVHNHTNHGHIHEDPSAQQLICHRVLSQAISHNCLL